MQNEPNWKMTQMTVTKALTTDYNRRTLGIRGKNEPKTNPNEPNFLDTNPHSKPKNGDFRQIQNNLFMQNEPNGMLYIN